MNYSDIANEAIDIKEKLTKIEKIISQLKACRDSHVQWYAFSFNIMLNNTIRGNENAATRNADTLKSVTTDHYKILVQNLTSIDFMELWIMLGELGSESENPLGISNFIQVMKKSYQTIHQFICITSTINIDEKYTKIVEAIDDMINEYNRINYTIDIFKQINQMLNIGIDESDFTIRLLAENNVLDNTLSSLSSIKDMYNTICSVINVSTDEEPLKYKRVESGSMLAFLAGNVVALGILGEIIKFSYDAYKEQFSWKARQEKALGEIKVRGEYLRLIKQYKAEGIEIISNEELQIKLADLEKANIELFKNNPHILLNGEDIGVPELQNQKIPDTFFLESAVDQLEDKK